MRSRYTSSVDPHNPIVQLCVQGMACERELRFHDALRLFEQAWAQSSDDFEFCIAAHYVARHQNSALDSLRWNQEALARADSAHDARVREFYPSLYLNLGKNHEDLGNPTEARRFYAQAASTLDALSPEPYRDVLLDAVARALRRT